MPTKQPLGTVPFTDGVERQVLLDADDRQFVIDGGGDRVYGVWILVDEPVVVGGEGTPS